MDFYPNPFEVGNLSTLGMAEEEMEERVRDMVADLKYQYGLCVPAYVVTEEMQRRGIPYEQLPGYMVEMIDDLDVY